MSPAAPEHTILIAESDAAQRSLLDVLLSPAGFKLEIRENGKEALEYLRDNTPDIAIFDAKMPYLGGFDVCSKMRRVKRLRDVPVVVLVPPFAKQKPGDNYRELLGVVGADILIPKPIGDKNLSERIRQLLADRSNDRPKVVADEDLKSTVVIEEAADVLGRMRVPGSDTESRERLEHLQQENDQLKAQIAALHRDLATLKDEHQKLRQQLESSKRDDDKGGFFGRFRRGKE
ncbi:MAG: response regulator [Trueperaceae bacterium]|nr:response regulator [Trueperaceae bacterium]